MILCDNAFCSGEVIELEYIALAGRKFCCVACAEAWSRQNEALVEAAAPLRESFDFRKERSGRNRLALKRVSLA